MYNYPALYPADATSKQNHGLLLPNETLKIINFSLLANVCGLICTAVIVTYTAAVTN